MTTSIECIYNWVSYKFCPSISEKKSSRAGLYWPKELLDNEYFGDKIDKTSKIKKLAAEVTAHAVSSQEKMASLYYWVCIEHCLVGK